MKGTLDILDCRQTPLGELILWRRQLTSLGGTEVFEVKLGDEYLMSSLFHAAETALADIALRELEGCGWQVVVGGLGLGYTAAAALGFEQLERLVVVEALGPVIDWHRRGLVPNSREIRRDPRCIFHQGDFFSLARGPGFDPEIPGYRFDAVLLDIDHTPEHLLHPRHGDFYSTPGLQRLEGLLKPGGIFALWSNDPPDESFLQVLRRTFAEATGHTVRFENPLLETMSSNGIYVARRK